MADGSAGPPARELPGDDFEVAPDGGGLTPKVRATRHVVWALLLGWLVLVALAVVLVAVV